MTDRRYGWLPDRPDPRDHILTLPSPVELPPVVDLRPACPPVYDQGQLGSCTANAIAGAIEFLQRREKIAETTPSRLFIYYNERALEGTVSEDAGAELRDGIKSVATKGACPEALWPYDVAKFAVTPPHAAYGAAVHHRVTSYARVARDATAFMACLASGYPFVFGVQVFASFESDDATKTGDIPMPASDEQLLGGHAILAVGYDVTTQRLRFRNSWGTGWGDAGYGTIPFAYVVNPNLAADFWAIRVT